MATAPIKLNSASFDYYLLRISSDIEVAKVASKLATLHDFDSSAKYLILELNSPIQDTKIFAKKLDEIVAIAASNQLEIKFIQHNEYTSAGHYGTIPVVDLPQTIRNDEPLMNKTLVVSQPVRSGIKVENDGDIIVKALVSHNAEIIATGHIHIYGDCRGRVIAGATGDKSARIFVTRFNAEMISIGGIFRVIEDKLPANLFNKSVEIFLDDKERLNIIPLGE